VQNTDEIWRLVDAKKGLFEQLSDQVWDTPELCYTEFRSCAEHTALLELQGFRVTKNVAGIPTAVVGEAGEDGPVVAILGEYDALPGLGQESGVAEAKPLPGDGHGHGCGHNLLGAASMLAATAVKDYLAARGIKGRVRYYGCPAEEGGAAKGFMARAGVFSDVDVAISWHPAAFSGVNEALSLANTRIGSGSDHTVFLNFLGIPTMGLTFVGPYGVYHSLYDDYFWMNHFGDPGYRYHTLMTQLWGALALRLANADVLPFDFESYGENIRQFVVDLNLANRVAGHIDLAALQRQIADFQSAGRELNQSIAVAIASGRLDAPAAAQVNAQLMQVERNWCNPNGIPGRPWFKHSLYAARYTYAHLELPGLTEASEAGDWKRANEQEKILETQLAGNTALLKKISQELNSAR